MKRNETKIFILISENRSSAAQITGPDQCDPVWSRGPAQVEWNNLHTKQSFEPVEKRELS